MSWLIVGYYTDSYKSYVDTLKQSCEEHACPCYFEHIQDQGGWYKNTQYKPTFLMSMLDKFPDIDAFIYIDVDAVIKRFPILFDRLENYPDIQFAAHILDHTKYRRKNHPPELLSGTLYMKNTQYVREVLERWQEACSSDSQIWDQRALALVLSENQYFNLPEEYCTIFDYMCTVQNPVIVHYQASRKHKKITVETGPRRSVKNDMVCIKRLHK